MTFAVEIVLEIVLFVRDFVFLFPFGESKFHGRSVLVNLRHTKTKGSNPSAWTCDTRQGEVCHRVVKKIFSGQRCEKLIQQ